jgi:hypothetical protein
MSAEEERLNEDPQMQSDDESEELSDSEYVTVDITEHPLYNVLTAVFEDTEGNNIVEKMNDLIFTVQQQTAMLEKTNQALLRLLEKE